MKKTKNTCKKQILVKNTKTKNDKNKAKDKVFFFIFCEFLALLFLFAALRGGLRAAKRKERFFIFIKKGFLKGGEERVS